MLLSSSLLSSNFLSCIIQYVKAKHGMFYSDCQQFKLHQSVPGADIGKNRKVQMQSKLILTNCSALCGLEYMCGHVYVSCAQNDFKAKTSVYSYNVCQQWSRILALATVNDF